MQVIKFGGSSVKNAERISAVIKIIKNKLATDNDCVVVSSAMGGVTDHLLDAACAARKSEDYQKITKEIEDRHLNCLAELDITDESLIAEIKTIFSELNDKLNGVKLLRELTAKTKDSVLATGERLSCRILTAAANAAGLEAQLHETSDTIITNDDFGNAQVDTEQTYQNISEYYSKHSGLSIATGFIARNTAGETTTLGRGGSDYTAALIGAALKVAQVEIWTDVDGLFTANPKKVTGAFPQSYVSFSEAMELAHFGAKVLYPPAIKPALSLDIPIIIKNSYNPDAPGTVIGQEEPKDRETICGVTSVESAAFLRLEGSGMVGRPNSARRMFAALGNQQINIQFITQASSEYTICIAVLPEDAEKAKKALEEEFSLEIQNKLIKPVAIQWEVAIISIVGQNMRQVPGVAGKMFTALGKNGINIVAIAQGSSEINISAVIEAKDQAKALQALHEEFFYPDTKTINVCLIGTGLIGAELLAQLKVHSEMLASKHDHRINLIAVGNSRKVLFDAKGINLQSFTLKDLDSAPESNLDKLLSQLEDSNLPNLLFVDCTASEKVASRYLDILGKNISIATPNKKAQSSDIAYFKKLQQYSSRRGVNFLYETSVGAGLPILGTLNDLIKSGDEVISIEGVFSGTLSYIFNMFQPGTQFADIVTDAQKNGLTEPDPREDLNGMDVARKILILSRITGSTLELSDIEVENLVPKNCRETKNIEEFFEGLKNAESVFQGKLSAADKNNQKLCYIAKYVDGKAKVKLEMISSDHPFYNLTAGDNIVSFKTRRYFDKPLIVRGPGAGAEVTAAGVFADIIRLANF